MSFPGTVIRRKNCTPLKRWLDALVVQADGCLTWGRPLSSAGYGSLSVDGRVVYTHRFAYEQFIGPIPENCELDHLCRNRACCNPAHLEAVSRRTNQIRGMGLGGLNFRKTHCVNGHEFTPENTYQRKDSAHRSRQCRTCHAERQGIAATSRPFCKNGHPRTPENTFIRADGFRRCLVCSPNYGQTTNVKGDDGCSVAHMDPCDLHQVSA